MGWTCTRRRWRSAAERAGPDTLILFTADHSYDFRIHDGRKGEPLLPEVTDPKFGDDQDTIRLANIRRDDDHTGEDVLVAGQGPGAERVRGFLANTDLFQYHDGRLRMEVGRQRMVLPVTRP